MVFFQLIRGRGRVCLAPTGRPPDLPGGAGFPQTDLTVHTVVLRTALETQQCLAIAYPSFDGAFEIGVVAEQVPNSIPAHAHMGTARKDT